MDCIKYYSSPLGNITLASDGTALTGLWFDGQRHFAETLGSDPAKASLPVFTAVGVWLDAYFSGSDPGQPPPLSPRGTPFRKAVWNVLLTIPYGHVMTYGAVADLLSAQNGCGRTSARAVGNAVGHNPISLLIPCHRVVGADGSLTGYAGGLERKEKLLMLEKAKIFYP